ncbi:MAG: HD domain-containing protein [Thermodesulfobacteriota bacterium]
MRCPGQDPMFWKPGDVFEIPCPKCGYGVEFLKYDVKRKCRCGHEIVNPKINFGCAEWCPYGDTCIEGLPEEIKMKTKEEKNNRLRGRIAQEMRRYFGNDLKRINHALKVAQYAEEILKIEGGNPLVVLGAAYLHDIGIKRAEEKYGSSAAEYQEKEGPEIAREILMKLNVQRGIIEEICDIISHHHHPRPKETLNFQILYEADLLVNFEEGSFKNKDLFSEMIDNHFKTQTGKGLAKELLIKMTI